MRDGSPAEGAASVRAMKGMAQRAASKHRAAKGKDRIAWRVFLDIYVYVGCGVWDIRAGELLLTAGGGEQATQTLRVTLSLAR